MYFKFNKERFIKLKMIYNPPFYVFGFDLKISDTRKPNNNDADIPPAEAVSPPVITPKNPFSSIAFFTPSVNSEPNPVSGTVAPAPAKSMIGLYKLNNSINAPTHTKVTSMRAGVSFVLSIRICPMTHIIPPTMNALM